MSVTLGDIVGHERVLTTLRQAVAGDTVHHAMLFAGPAGVGKLATARAFAALLNCTGDNVDADGRRHDACGACKSCRHILSEASEHPDVLELRPDGRQIKIGQVRDLLRIVAFPPLEASVRVVIVEPADALGDEAANALLKTLEEPSSHTRFILVSAAADALLVTIRSRCQRVVFGRIPPDALAGLLVSRHGIAAARAAEVAAVADGSIGQALALLDDPVMSQRNALLAQLLDIAPGDALAAFAFAADLYDLRKQVDTVLDVFARLYRDALLLRSGAQTVADSAHAQLGDALAALAARLGPQALLTRLELIEDTRHGLAERNLNPRLSLERLVLALTAPAGQEGVRFDARALTEAGR